MKAIIASTYDDQYLFYLPITVWCWKLLGIDTIIFLPDAIHSNNLGDFLNKLQKDEIARKYTPSSGKFYYFKCPDHKAATYAQCSRLYASALDLNPNDVLLTSDIDMLVFKNDFKEPENYIRILGADLVPQGQFPMCFAWGMVSTWREAMQINGRTYQQCLDDLVGVIECEQFRGNLWSLDQGSLHSNLASFNGNIECINRARPGTQFAQNRIDRDDSYYLERLNGNVLDYHMHRPGHTEENFLKILKVIQYFYPREDLSWMREYQQKYNELV